jgi:hypothetical protein
MLTLESIEKLAGIAESAITVIAILVGGIWALRKYVVTREGVWNLRMNIDYEVLPYSDSSELLLLYVIPENIGKVVVIPGRKGCVVYVRLVPKITDRKVPFLIQPEDMGAPVLKEEIMWSRGSAGDVPKYEIEPGLSYRHTVPLVVPRGALIEVRAMFWRDEEDATSARRIIDLSQERRSGIAMGESSSNSKGEAAGVGKGIKKKTAPNTSPQADG